MKRVHLVVIDGQNDFLRPDGALYVEGADAEAARLAALIKREGPKITKIHPTLDSHHPVDIAHPVMWKDENGNHPAPLTIITSEEVRQGKWMCALSGYYNKKNKITYQDKCLSYVEALDKNGRYPLCIWNPHCLIGSTGHLPHPALYDAYAEWVRVAESDPWINYVTKGDFPFSEHYSAIVADVPEPGLEKTQINEKLLNDLDTADLVVWAGWAGSHCLANTCRDTMNYFDEKQNTNFIKKSVLLLDTCAPVADPPGTTMFTDMRTNFLNEMRQRGMQFSTTDGFSV